jgi:hypothetical protein
MSDQSKQFKKQMDMMFQIKFEGEDKSHYIDEEPHMLHYAITGGFHPLVLGQHLNIINPGPRVGKNATFEIVRKLGLGLYSTVWLVRSTGYGNPLVYMRFVFLVTDFFFIDAQR